LPIIACRFYRQLPNEPTPIIGSCRMNLHTSIGSCRMNLHAIIGNCRMGPRKIISSFQTGSLRSSTVAICAPGHRQLPSCLLQNCPRLVTQARQLSIGSSRVGCSASPNLNKRDIISNSLTLSYSSTGETVKASTMGEGPSQPVNKKFEKQVRIQ